MCTLVDDFINISYRVGSKYRPPIKDNEIPIGIFAWTGAGSRGLIVRYLLSVLDGGASFDSGDVVVQGSLVATQGGYRAAWDPNHGLNTSPVERVSDGHVHTLVCTAGRIRDIRVALQLEVEWQPIVSPYAVPSALDERLLTGSRSTTFPAVFPSTEEGSDRRA